MLQFFTAGSGGRPCLRLTLQVEESEDREWTSKVTCDRRSSSVFLASRMMTMRAGGGGGWDMGERAEGGGRGGLRVKRQAAFMNVMVRARACAGDAEDIKRCNKGTF